MYCSTEYILHAVLHRIRYYVRTALLSICLWSYHRRTSKWEFVCSVPNSQIREWV